MRFYATNPSYQVTLADELHRFGSELPEGATLLFEDDVPEWLWRATTPTVLDLETWPQTSRAQAAR